MVFPYQPQLMCVVALGSAIKGAEGIKNGGMTNPRYKEGVTTMEKLMKTFSATLYGE
ncbi:hypothetical protein OkiPb00243_38410 [Escherichia coli]